MIHTTFSLIVITILTGCVYQNAAPIEYNHNTQTYTPVINHDSSVNDYDDKIVTKKMHIKDQIEENPTGFLKETYKNPADEEVQAYNSPLKTIYHEVTFGETLEQIAANYKQDIEEIAKLNNLSKPYQVEEFQIIKINTDSELLNQKNKERQSADQHISITNNTDVGNIIDDKHKFIPPISGTVITNFGDPIAGGKSKGINILAAEGTQVKSIANGMVIYTGHDKKFGNLVIIKLEHDLFAAYAHLDRLELKKGDVIKQGELVGHVGSTGSATHPQLYFAIKRGGQAVDPLNYIKFTKD